MITLLTALAYGGTTLGGAVEADLVGAFGMGPRFEATWKPGDGPRGHALLVAAGVVPTSEFVFLPVTVGWRSSGRTDHAWAPLVGLGSQAQMFVVQDHPFIARHAFYGEFGARWSPRDDLALLLAASPELTVFGVPGVGFAVRFGVAFGP